MGEIADMMINGEICCLCGMDFADEYGFPKVCAGCGGDGVLIGEEEEEEENTIKTLPHRAPENNFFFLEKEQHLDLLEAWIEARVWNSARSDLRDREGRHMIGFMFIEGKRKEKSGVIVSKNEELHIKATEIVDKFC